VVSSASHSSHDIRLSDTHRYVRPFTTCARSRKWLQRMLLAQRKHRVCHFGGTAVCDWQDVASCNGVRVFWGKERCSTKIHAASSPVPLRPLTFLFLTHCSALLAARSLASCGQLTTASRTWRRATSSSRNGACTGAHSLAAWLRVHSHMSQLGHLAT
jgi:hypothetical protein